MTTSPLKRLTEVTTAPADKPGVVDDTKLAAVATWVAGGFTLLAALLTFFGIREGLLDRILRAYPRQSLFVFCLVGLAVIAATVSPALAPSQRINLALPLLAALTLGAATWTLLPDFAPDDQAATAHLMAAAAAALLLLAAIAAIRCDLRVPLVAGALLVAVASLALGLYGAAKMSVTSKIGRDRPDVAVSVSGSGAATALTLAVTAARLDQDEAVEIAIVDPGSDSGEADDLALGRHRLHPDAGGTVSRTITAPVGTRSRAVSIRAAICARDEPCTPTTADERALIPLGATATPLLGASVAVAGDVVTFTATGSGFQGQRVRLRVVEGDGDPAPIAAITAAPDSAGDVKVSVSVRPRAGVLLRLTQQNCSPDECSGQTTDIASYMHR